MKEKCSFQEIIDKMEIAEEYAELYQASELIEDPSIREQVIKEISICESDGDDVDVAYSVVTTDILDSLAMSGDKNIFIDNEDIFKDLPKEEIYESISNGMFLGQDIKDNINETVTEVLNSYGDDYEEELVRNYVTLKAQEVYANELDESKKAISEGSKQSLNEEVDDLGREKFICPECNEENTVNWSKVTTDLQDENSQLELHKDGDSYSFYGWCKNCGELTKLEPPKPDLKVKRVYVDEDGMDIILMDRVTKRQCWIYAKQDKDGEWLYEFNNQYDLSKDEDIENMILQNQLDLQDDELYELMMDTIKENEEEYNKLQAKKKVVETQGTKAEYVLIPANSSRIKQLEKHSAFTWVGMNISAKNLESIVEFFKENTPNIKLPINFFTWKGKEFNELYGLTGKNTYPEDLNFLAIDLDNWDGLGVLPMIKLQVGARWLDDIVDNNAFRQKNLEEGYNKVFKVTEAEDMGEVKDNIEKAKEGTKNTEQEIDQVKGSLEVLKTDEEEAIAGYDTFVDNSSKVVDDKLANAIDDEMQEIIQDEKDHIEKLDTIKSALGESKEKEINKVQDKISALKELEVSTFNELREELDTLLEKEIINEEYEDFLSLISDKEDDCFIYLKRRGEVTNQDWKDELDIEDSYVQDVINEMINMLSKKEKKVEAEDTEYSINNIGKVNKETGKIEVNNNGWDNILYIDNYDDLWKILDMVNSINLRLGNKFFEFIIDLETKNYMAEEAAGLTRDWLVKHKLITNLDESKKVIESFDEPGLEITVSRAFNKADGKVPETIDFNGKTYKQILVMDPNGKRNENTVMFYIGEDANKSDDYFYVTYTLNKIGEDSYKGVENVVEVIDNTGGNDVEPDKIESEYNEEELEEAKTKKNEKETIIEKFKQACEDVAYNTLTGQYDDSYNRYLQYRQQLIDLGVSEDEIDEIESLYEMSNEDYLEFEESLKTTTYNKKQESKISNKRMIDLIDEMFYWLSEVLDKDDINEALKAMGVSKAQFDGDKDIPNDKLLDVLNNAIDYVSEHVSRSDEKDTFKYSIGFTDEEMKELGMEFEDNEEQLDEDYKLLNEIPDIEVNEEEDLSERALSVLNIIGTPEEIDNILKQICPLEEPYITDEYIYEEIRTHNEPLSPVDLEQAETEGLFIIEDKDNKEEKYLLDPDKVYHKKLTMEGRIFELKYKLYDYKKCLIETYDLVEE